MLLQGRHREPFLGSGADRGHLLQEGREKEESKGRGDGEREAVGGDGEETSNQTWLLHSWMSGMGSAVF